MTGMATGWSSATLSEVARWGSGGTPRARTAAYYGGGIPWAVIGDLNDGIVTDTRSTITEAGLAASSAKLIPEGALMVAMYGSIGKLGIAGREMSTNQAIAFALPEARILPRFLFYYLLHQRHTLDAAGKGATQRNISQTILKAWPVQFPNDLDEQGRIVEMLEDHLSRLDAASAQLLTSARRLTGLRRAVLDHVINVRGRTMVELGDLLERIEAGRSVGKASHAAGPDEWGIVKISAMTWGEFRPDENKAVPADLADSSYEIHDGDLLLSRANTSVYVGASVLVGQVRPRLLLSDKSLRIVPSPNVDRQWLQLALSSPSARHQISNLATGTKDSMRNISQRALLSVKVPEVNVDQQARDVAACRSILASTRRLTDELSVAAARDASLRRSLLNAAFSGRLTGQSSDLDRAEETAATAVTERAVG